LECDVRAELGEIPAPILYLRAENDSLVGKASLEEILAANPKVSIESIPGPHLLLQREPQRCAEIIERFAWAAFAADQ
jgi:pimeloyl-ACP methyl ester carboxylesterase